jgi:multidrug efflux system membrane fusion protein
MNGQLAGNKVGRIAIGGFAILGGAFLNGCNERGVSGASPGARSADVPVTVATSTRADVPVQVQAIGWVEAYASVTIRPQVEGQLTEIHFTEGQDVKTGDLLLSIDTRPFVAALRLAEANLRKDQALAEDAQREAKRVAELFANNVAADRERDAAQAAADAADAQVLADQAAIESANLRLEYCTIRSPIDGRTGARLVDRGNIAKANETALVTVNQISPIYVTFSVAERHLPSIKKYMATGPLTVEARYADDSAPTPTGRLTFVDNQADTLTGMVRLKATFSNEDHNLWPGRFVNVTLTLATQSGVLVVPSQAIQIGQKGQFVFVVRPDRTVEMRPIAVGSTVGERTVVTEGLEAGEVVVTDGQLRLTPGAKVRPTESAGTNGG